MSFTAAACNPTDGLKNVTSYPEPASETVLRTQLQTGIDQAIAAINTLIGELQNTDSGVSGAAYVGSQLITGVSGTTVRAQLVDLKTQLDAISAGSVSDGTITTAKLAADAVDGTKLADDAVDSEHIAAGAIDAEHYANDSVGTEALGTIQEITLDTGDTLTYDTTNNKLKLNVSGCTAVQLCPIVFGTSATPPTGDYPAGTLYIQHS